MPSPPAESFRVPFVRSVVDQERWALCKKRNYITRAQEEVFVSMGVQQYELFPHAAREVRRQYDVSSAGGKANIIAERFRCVHANLVEGVAELAQTS
jgi:hypothetical protein